MEKQILFLVLICSILGFVSCNNSSNKNKEDKDTLKNAFVSIEEDIILKSDTISIYGTLSLPAKEGKYPVVLIIPGSGPTDRDGNSVLGVTAKPFKLLADTLAQSGIASVRYDKRLVGESAVKGYSEEQLRIDDYMDDAAKWIEMLKNDERFTKVIVLGHSEGSLIGIIACQMAKPDAYISVAGPSQPADSMLLTQLSTLDKEDYDQAVKILGKLRKGEKMAATKPSLFALFRTSVQPYLISWIRYNPKEEIAKLDIPVLVIGGTTDIQVGYQDAVALSKALEGSEVKIIEGMNHILKDAPADTLQNQMTYMDSGLPLNKEFSSAVIGFIKKLEIVK